MQYTHSIPVVIVMIVEIKHDNNHEDHNNTDDDNNHVDNMEL